MLKGGAWVDPLPYLVEGDEMTYDQFKEFMERYEAEQKEKPADDWAVDSLDWAAVNGIMEGDGNGNLMPIANVTREQFATMLHRFASDLEKQKTK